MSYGPPTTQFNPMLAAQPQSIGTPYSQYGTAAPHVGSAREPLSLQHSLGLQLEWAFQGFWDALDFQSALTLILEDSEIQAHVLRSALLNILSILSVWAFDIFILPLLDPKDNKWFHKHFEALYQAFWLAPLVALSLFLNLRWCAFIADRAFSLKHGRKAVSASPYTGMVAHIASSAYRAILIASYLTLSFLFAYIPYIGTILSFSYICWVNSYYCFEYIWIARGMTLSQRVKHEEDRWAYYFAFGFPSAIICMWGSSLGNAAIFALVFPYFIIQAMHATPVPANPSSPTSNANGPVMTTPLAPLRDVGTDGHPQSPHHFVPVRLPIFAPVILLNNGLVRLLSVTGASRATKRSLGLNTLVSAGDGDIIGGEAGLSSSASPSSSYGYVSPVKGSPVGGGGGAVYRVRRRKGD